MNFKELFEGVEPKMPGAPEGIQIMTPQQFVASAGDMPGEESEEGVAEVSDATLTSYLTKLDKDNLKHRMDPTKRSDAKRMKSGPNFVKAFTKLDNRKQGVAEGSLSEIDRRGFLKGLGAAAVGAGVGIAGDRYLNKNDNRTPQQIITDAIKSGKWSLKAYREARNDGYSDEEIADYLTDYKKYKQESVEQGVAEGGYPEVDHMPGPTIKRTQTGCKICHGKGYVYKTPDGETHPMNRPDAKKYKCGKCDGIGFVKVAEQGVEEGVRDLGYDAQSLIMKLRRDVEEKRLQPTPQAVLAAARELAGDMEFAPQLLVKQVLGQGVAEGSEAKDDLIWMLNNFDYYTDDGSVYVNDAGEKIARHGSNWKHQSGKMGRGAEELGRFLSSKQDMAEGEDHLARIRKLSGLEEATKLPASSREFGGDEFQDYMKRIAGTPDVDKQGNVKLDKKGNEKYVSGKTKADRYKMPYIHRSSVITYLSPDGKTYDEEAVKKTLGIRPKALLKQNEKMKHSNGEFEQFFNVGFAALTGIAVDEQTDNLIIVNTCPGAGSCKVDCFAMKGGKVQFQGPWQSDGRILTYLLNDPDGFFNQLSAEITKESVAGKKGDKKFPNGWQTTIRWHDAGDFFSPEYLDMALKMAAKHPDVKFYAYTKMAGAALAQKPPNFIINWSEGAHTSQEKQVKASDANLDTTKNSRIVPDEIFQDLLVKDEKKNLVKGEQGQWQVQPDKLPELKQRLAKEYGLSANSILDYNEYMAKRKSIPAGMKYNVIVAPGEGDISANDPNIISTLLLKH